MSRITESAERIMTTAVPVVGETTTVKEVEDVLRKNVSEFVTINYIYIVGRNKSLLGVISIRELFGLSANELVFDHASKTLVTARPHTSQGRVAQLALHHSLKAIPVVSKEQMFLGVVPSDTILAVLSHEHTKDVFRFAGVNKETGALGEIKTFFAQSSLVHVKSRLPWLVLGLLGGVLAAVVVGKFEETLADQLILAAFIPAIVYMADAVGSQTQMLFIRALSTQLNLSVKNYLKRELQVNFILGLILAFLAFLLSFAWLQSVLVSTVLSLSIFLTVWFTVFIAIALPWFFFRRGLDPAIASGPLATVVRDIMSLCIYLSIATLLL